MVVKGITVKIFHTFKYLWVQYILHIICPAVFRTFDKDNDSFVSVKEWIEGLSIFLRGTLEEKIKCKSTFTILNLNDKLLSQQWLLSACVTQTVFRCTTWTVTTTSPGRKCFTCWRTVWSGSPLRRTQTRGLKIWLKSHWREWWGDTNSSDLLYTTSTDIWKI